MIKIAVFASGSGTNAENIINYFTDSEDVKISLILSNNSDAGVLSRAERLGVPAFVFSNKVFYESAVVLKILTEYEIDFVVLAGFLIKIPSEIIEPYWGKIINIHPALLPGHGGKGMYGRHVHEAVIAAGDRETGITIHFVNDKYDEGQIVFQSKIPVLQEDTPESIEKKIHELEYRYYPEVIGNIVKNYKKQ